MSADYTRGKATNFMQQFWLYLLINHLSISVLDKSNHAHLHALCVCHLEKQDTSFQEEKKGHGANWHVQQRRNNLQ